MRDHEHHLVIGMGFREDSWQSMWVFAKHLVDSLERTSSGLGKPFLFSPTLGRKPRWFDRRLRYSYGLPCGEILHLIDHSYGDALLTAANKFEHVLATIHDMAFWDERGSMNSIFRKRIVRGLACAGRRVAVSNATAERVLSQLGLEVHHIISPGVDDKTFKHHDGARIPRLLLNVGSSIFRKGLDRLFLFLSSLPSEFHLLQIGAEFSSTQKQLIHDLKIEHRVRNISHGSEKELLEAYQTAEILVAPSRYEGFCVPIIEARMVGTLVVADSEIPATQLLKDDSGTLKLSFSAFEQGCSEAQRKKELGRFKDFQKSFADGVTPLANRAYFSWDRVAKEYMAVYRDLQSSSLS